MKVIYFKLDGTNPHSMKRDVEIISLWQSLVEKIPWKILLKKISIKNPSYVFEKYLLLPFY